MQGHPWLGALTLFGMRAQDEVPYRAIIVAHEHHMAQPAYLNQMVLLETRLGPRGLLEACHAIEQAEGRVRQERWGARTLDVDIVRFGERHVAEPDLIIPHPELPNRDFWQRELAELQAHDR